MVLEENLINTLDHQKDEQIKPETWLEEMTKLKLSCFRHIMRWQGSLEKKIMLRIQKAAGKEKDQV